MDLKPSALFMFFSSAPNFCKISFVSAHYLQDFLLLEKINPSVRPEIGPPGQHTNIAVKNNVNIINVKVGIN